MARRLHAEVSRWEETQWAMYKRDAEYFSRHRLLYLPEEELLDLDDRIDERRRYEECDRVPGCVNLDDDAPPLPTDEDLQWAFEKNPNLEALIHLFGADAKAFTHQRPKSSAAATPGDSESRVASNEVELGELCDAEHDVCTVQAFLDGNPSNLEFSSMILERSEALFEKLQAESLDADVEFAVSGQYRNAPMTQRAVSLDLMKTSLVSLVLVLLIVLLQFRGWRSLPLLFVPVTSGILWTILGLSFVHPRLNLISAFTLAVLAGIGIDFGVHLLTHYGSARRRGALPEQALGDTFAALGPSLLVAGGTTACGFFALGVASFRGFSEMGPIAGVGVLLSLLASLLLFPPMVFLLDRADECPFALRRYRGTPFGWLSRRAVPVATGGVLLAVLFGALGAGVFGRGVEFEYDFRKLQPKAVSHGIPWRETLHGTTRTAVYMLANDQAALADAADQLRADPPTEVVKGDEPFLIVPGGFVPPDQERRLAAVARLERTLDAARKVAEPELVKDIDAFSELVGIKEPIRDDSLPRWVSSWLRERDGRFGTLGILYTDLGGSDARQMEVLVRNMQRWRERFPHVRFASPVAQLGEVTPRLRSEGPWIFGLALLGVLLGTLLVGRSFRRTLTVLLPLVVTVALSMGVMALCQIRVNLYNMLVFPLAFGIGIDGAVYVTYALGNAGDDGTLRAAARAVLGSTLTTVAAFGSLMVSNNPGLASIGLMALVMLSASLLANLIWLPAVNWASVLRFRNRA